MYRMLDGDIVAGVGINGVQLNSSLEELEQVIDGDYAVRELRDAYIIEVENAKIWLLRATNTVHQVMVCGGFKGTFRGIGIGSTLADVRRRIGEWVQEVDTYVLPDTPGICFQLGEGEGDPWNELAVPIEYISVYNP